MLGAGIFLAWLGYGVGSYGYNMVRGYDVPLRAWFSPLNPYQWPGGGPAPIPDTQLFPGSKAAAAPASGSNGDNSGRSSSPSSSSGPASSGGGGLGGDIRRAWDWFWG